MTVEEFTDQLADILRDSLQVVNKNNFKQYYGSLYYFFSDIYEKNDKLVRELNTIGTG